MKIVPIVHHLSVRVREFEEVAAFLPQVEEAVSDVSKFSSVSLSILSGWRNVVLNIKP